MTQTPDSYFIPQQFGEATYKSLNSKFIAFAIPVQSSEQAKEQLRALRHKYYDATHVCYAWILGRNAEEKMAADAGEPAHTAGTPILNAIRSAGITYVMVAVVRYYGGTKLGVPGLIHAYGTAAQMALQVAGKTECIPRTNLTFTCAYEHISIVHRLLARFRGLAQSESYDQKVQIVASFPEAEIPHVFALAHEYGLDCNKL